MLRIGLTHPQILHALARAGHGSLVLLSDGNFPHATVPYQAAPRVYLNVRPGLITVIDALEAISAVLAVESAAVMVPSDGSTPPIHGEFAAVLGALVPITALDRNTFYDATASSNLALVIATGEQRTYANLLLTIGVVDVDAAHSIRE